MKNLIPAVLLLTCAVNAKAAIIDPTKVAGEEILTAEPVRPPVPRFASMSPAFASFVQGGDEAERADVKVSVPMPLAYYAPGTPDSEGRSWLERIAAENKSAIVSYLKGVGVDFWNPEGKGHLYAKLTRRQAKFLAGFPGVLRLSMEWEDRPRGTGIVVFQ